MAETVKRKINIFFNDKELGRSIRGTKTEYNKLKREILGMTEGTEEYIRTAKRISTLDARLRTHRKNISGIGAGMNQANKQMGGFRKTAMKLGSKAGAIGMVAGAVVGATRSFGGWIKTNKEMQFELSKLQSLTNASSKDLIFYKKSAREAGQQTTASGIDIVKAYALIGSAKPELLKSKEALTEITRDVITLAEASTEEVPAAATALTTALNQMSASADESKRFINALAAGSLEGAGNIPYLTQAMEKSASVGKDLGLEIEDMVASIETIAPKVSEASTAGLQLKGVFLEMASGPDKFNPQVVGMTKALDNLAKEGFDAAGKARAKFGKQNVVAVTTLIKQRERFNELKDAVTGTNTAFNQAEINTRNLDGATKSMGSAWENFLTFFDGNTVLADIVNWGADMLNTFTDLLGALKNWDTIKMEASMHKLAKVLLPLTAFLFDDYYDNLVRISGLSDTVVDAMKDEGREVDILTTRLAENNKALKETAKTEEEKAKITEESSRIVAELEGRYGELTEGYDLNNASAEELIELQEKINDNLVKQAIETAKAAEAERLMGEIMAKSIELSKKRAQEANRSEGKKDFIDFVNKFTFGLSKKLNDKLGITSDGLKSELDGLTENLTKLDETFAEVENIIDEANINFGEDYDAQTAFVIEAAKELEKLQIQLSKTNDEATKNSLSQQIKGQEKLLKDSGVIKQDILDDILDKTKRAEESAEAEITEMQKREAQKRANARKKAGEQRKKDLEKIYAELDRIIKFEADKSAGFLEQKLLDSAKEGQEKELLQLQLALDKKYDAEVANAEKIAKELGKRAPEAAAVINRIKLDKATELEYGKQQITDKFEKISQEKMLENLEKRSQLEINARKAQHKLRVLEAELNFREIGEYEISAKKEAMDELLKALKEQGEFELATENDILRQKLLNGEITEAEFEALREANHQEHLNRMDEAKNAAAERDRQRKLKLASDVLTAMNETLDIVKEVTTAIYSQRLEKIEATHNQDLAALDDRKEKGLISEEQYIREKENIDGRYRKREAAVKTKAAKADKALAIVQAGINTALAVTKALSSSSPPFNFIMAGIAAAAGVAQIAIIAAKPIPQFKDGGFHNVTGAQDGKNYNAKYIGKHQGGMLPSTPSIVLASEDGAEYYTPAPLLKNPEVADHVNAIEAIRTNQRKDGGYNNTSENGDSQQVINIKSNESVVNMQLVNELARLNNFLDNPKFKIGESEIEQIGGKLEQQASIRG
jgi:TP901 family phage tail tape measure protein